MFDQTLTERDAENILGYFCVVNAFAAPLLMVAGLEALDLLYLIEWTAELTLWLKLPLMIGLWAVSFVVVGGTGLALLALVGLAIKASVVGILHLGSGIVWAVSALFGFGVSLAGLAFGFVTHPFRVLWQEGMDRMRGLVALMQERLRETAELRRLYNEEFRDEFETFEAFKKAFHENARQDQARAEYEQARTGSHEGTKADPFEQACKLLGLPESGAFTQDELKARYRVLIRGVHPDVAGENGVASEINAAYAFIKKMKGWS